MQYGGALKDTNITTTWRPHASLLPAHAATATPGSPHGPLTTVDVELRDCRHQHAQLEQVENRCAAGTESVQDCWRGNVRQPSRQAMVIWKLGTELMASQASASPPIAYHPLKKYATACSSTAGRPNCSLWLPRNIPTCPAPYAAPMSKMTWINTCRRNTP